MIGFVVVTLLAFLALVYVTGPVRTRKAPPQEKTLPPIVAEAEERKRRSLIAILDVEEERDSGKLAEPDYRELRARYEREALESLHALDLLATSQDEAIEAEIARIRSELTCPACGSFRATGTRCETCARA